MNSYPPYQATPHYDVWKTIRKAVGTSIAGAVGFAVAWLVSHRLIDEPSPDEIATFVGGGTVAVMVAIRAAANWLKHKGGFGLANLFGSAIVLMLIPLAGCASLNNAFDPAARPSVIEINAQDSVGGQLDPQLAIQQDGLPKDARYTGMYVKAKLPPGVNIKDTISFLADSEKMTFNSSPDYNTQGQADYLTESAKIWSAVLPGVISSAIDAALQAYGIHASKPEGPPDTQWRDALAELRLMIETLAATKSP